MGWFDDQIKTRILNDQESLEQSLYGLASVVSGKKDASAVIRTDRKKTQDAISEILRFYQIKSKEIPEKLEETDEILEYLLRPAGIMRRRVRLENNWYKDSIGPLLARTKQGDAAALLPDGFTGYSYYDYQSKQKVRINRKSKDQILEDAYCFYKPFPLRSLKARDLFVFIFEALSKADYAALFFSTTLITALGFIPPFLNKLLFERIIPAENVRFLFPIVFVFVGMILSTTLMKLFSGLVLNRMLLKMRAAAEAASMARILSLPASFFKEYNSGELASISQYVSVFCSTLANGLFSSGLNAVVSLVYLFQISLFASSLLVPACLIFAVMLLYSILSIFIQIQISQKQMISSSKLNGLVFGLFSGIQKIKLSGAEKRAFTKWAESYKTNAELSYDLPWMLKMQPVAAGLIAMAGSILIYFTTAMNHISTANYMAFNVSYGMASSAILSFSGIALMLANLKPILEIIHPILQTEPEISEGKEVIRHISGLVEMNHVSFRYTEDTPFIIADFSLKIKPGQSLAIVGTTGSGKSTLVRLLLGFEKPQKGVIYYDGKDLLKLDLKSLRSHIGSVTQNGKLFSGDIRSNILLAAPQSSTEDAWKAAEIAGIAEDIRNMPMGMFTYISEGNGGISGGQKQRLMIARAIAHRPKILIFDEATSALDNITQKQISDALDQMKCTRIIIAHRLSTIKNCDRIIVLDKGRILEDGNYETLINRNGHFAELVKRQRTDLP
ncbi:ATP-binding cassette domain-containing protein [Flexilinea flocculi]|uniref:ABC-type bacteriocin/lantibiotic exporter n=1 Tax=Flexilinea flocculi TaxID=1678840 RepID=A0A0K8P949_9CHLR|nr:ATP-binding cassette domain-containing protein [Flexilinea flocculi]GAP39168.1 ABC-type bacteriocin/lantibiotic exporter [Flexilinea flocculi]